MYVYISETCQQEAKLYQIEQKLEELANWVKKGSRPDFFKLFEIFQHPYYVRKSIGYRYRLLAKMIDVPFEEKNYQIVVFFRLFLRGDDEYKTLFCQADKHGDFFYNQQNLYIEIASYVANIANSSYKSSNGPVAVRISHSDSLAYFIQAKTNLLQLSQRANNEEYYQEDIGWYYGARPFLTEDDLQTIYQHIQKGLDTLEPQYFDINDTSLEFQTSPLRLNLAHDAPLEAFKRYLPSDTVFDSDSWLAQQRNALPLYLNAFQQTVCDAIFQQNDSFPLLVNAPALHGKTSLLAILTAHYLLQLPGVNQNVLPVLFICQTHEKLPLRLAIANYLYYQANNNSSIQLDFSTLTRKIEACCMDIQELAESLVANLNANFDQDLFIDRHKFDKLWNKAPFIKNQKLSYIPAELAWFVIQHIIKGKQDILGEGKAFGESLTNYSGSTTELHQLIHDEIWLDWYQPLQEEGYWDLHDLLAFVNRQSDFSQRYASILVDNAEQYSNLAMQVMLRCSEWWERPNLFIQAPIVFIGNIYASIPHKIYHWQNELNTLLYRLYRDQSNDEQLQTQRIEYDVADFVTTTSYALQTQRSKTNLIAFDKSLNAETVLMETQLLFIDTNDAALTQALLLNHKIALVVNSNSRDAKNILKNTKMVGDWFYYADVTQIERSCYSLALLPTKQHSLALFGFSHQDFSYFKQDSKEFAFLDFEKRYQLNSILNSLRAAVQQGLKRILILGKTEELPLWQALFGSVLGASTIQTATFEDVNPSYQQQTEQFLIQKQQALESSDIELIFNVALQHYQRFEYPQYFYLLLHICELTQDYQDYFDNLMNEQQQQLTFEYLWQHEKVQVILDYQDYFTKSARYNIMGLQIINDLPLSLSFEQAFVYVTNQYVKQCQQQPYATYWQVVFESILQKLFDETLSINWSGILNQLHKLKDAGIDIPLTVFAMSYYQQGNSEKSMKLWQQIESNDSTVLLPKTYYEHCLEKTTDWQEQVLIVIKLKNLGALMNILTNHELNDLQAHYWDKILPYLTEEDELETVLLTLLPQIHAPEVLERIYQYCQFDASENFLVRLQRLKTLQACLQGDWDTVIERLQHYVPVQDTDDMMSKLSQVFTTKKVMRGPNHMQKTVMRDKLPKPSDEIVDVLYALNLNPDIYMPMTVAEFEEYQKIVPFQKIFDLIRQNLSLQSNDDFNDVLWSIDFPAVRGLAYLLEKSDDPTDALVFYANITSFSKNKKLITFAMERLYLLLNRAKKFIEGGLDISNFTSTNSEEEATDDLTTLINKLEKHYGKLLKDIRINDDAINLPTLKTCEELVKSILALTDKEHREIQRIAQEQRQAMKKQEAEAKRIEEEEQQQAEQRARIEHALRLKEIEEEQRIQAEQQDQQRLENERLEREQLQQEIAAQAEVEESKTGQEQNIAVDVEQSSSCAQALTKSEHLDECIAHFDKSFEEVLVLDDLDTSKICVVNEDYNEAKLQDTKQMAEQPNNIKQAIGNPALSQYNTIAKPAIMKATSELQFFHWRVFVSRMLKRVNIEDTNTGERCSVTLEDGVFSSDWPYSQLEEAFTFIAIPLMIIVSKNSVVLSHIEHGIELKIHF